MKKVGIYSGSFNPIHHGHVMLANYLVEFADLDELWFVVTPQNPLKQKEELLDDDERLKMVQLAVGDDPRLKVSDIEMHLPTPSYTINTLTSLSEQCPDCKFIFICGMDSLQNFKNWREYQRILDNYELLVFPREGYDGGELINYPSVTVLNCGGFVHLYPPMHQGRARRAAFHAGEGVRLFEGTSVLRINRFDSICRDGVHTVSTWKIPLNY